MNHGYKCVRGRAGRPAGPTTNNSTAITTVRR